MNHTVYFRHSNVNKRIDKTLFRSLFFLFFNIAQATTCPQLSENSQKKFRREMSGFEIPRKKSFKKNTAEKYGVPRNTI